MTRLNTIFRTRVHARPAIGWVFLICCFQRAILRAVSCLDLGTLIITFVLMPAASGFAAPTSQNCHAFSHHAPAIVANNPQDAWPNPIREQDRLPNGQRLSAARRKGPRNKAEIERERREALGENLPRDRRNLRGVPGGLSAGSSHDDGGPLRPL